MPKKFVVPVIMILLLAAAGCASLDSAVPAEAEPTIAPTAESETSGTNPRPAMGPGSGMMARHHAPIPDEYAGLTNLVPADDDSLLRGAAIYDQHCTTCHGDGGMGDGPAGQHLDPAPAPVAHSSRMLGDDYLFWRISEGGGHDPFSSAMPRWQDVLNDTDRWDVINYIRALGSGREMPGRGPRMDEAFDPAAEALRHEQMAADGVQQKVLSQEEADTFVAVHAHLDQLMETESSTMSGTMESMQQEMLAKLVAGDVITQTEADMFTEAHDSLLEAGLMQ